MQTDKDIQIEIQDSDLKTLRELWDTGKLQTISDHLLEFIGRHSQEVRVLVQGAVTTESWVEAVRQLVRRRGSIHLPSELADQIREINNHLWYAGERGDSNRVKLKEEWPLLYAQKWREWRTKEILYVIERRAAEVAGSCPA